MSKIRVWQIFTIAIILLTVLISIPYSSEPDVNIVVIQSIIISCIPLFLLISTVRDVTRFKQYITVLAMICPYAMAFTVFIIGTGGLEGSSSYDQSMSYTLLLPSIVLISSLMEQFSSRKLIPLLLGVLMMLSYGARGPVACLIIFIMLKFLLILTKGNNKKKIQILSVLLLSSIALYLNFYKILQLLTTSFEAIGFSTRTVNSLMNNSFLVDQGRNRIYKVCFDRIIAEPFLGTGIVNDRIYIKEIIYTGQNAIGSYPHNFIIELLLQFGLPIGVAVLTGFVILVERTLFRNTDENIKSVVLIFIGFAFLPLLFSRSYISSTYFWGLLGLCGAMQMNARNMGNEL